VKDSWSAADVEALLKRDGYTYADLGEVVGRSHEAIRNWVQGKHPVSPEAFRDLNALWKNPPPKAPEGPWLVYPDMDPASVRFSAHFRVRRTMRRVLEPANLPAHFTPHGLRHTYASLLLQRGESLLYVSRQLGHRHINMTADLYGRWLRIEPQKGGPNLLEGGPVVAFSRTGHSDSPQRKVSDGE
jgi:hypothetical protein